jgi:hypothetical protein
MTKIMKKHFLYLFLFFAFISCSDNVKFNNPAFEGQKDNVFWRAVDAKATLVDGILTIEGFTRNEKLTLTIPSPQTSVSHNDKNSYVAYSLGTTDQDVMASYASLSGALSSPMYQTLVIPGPVNKVLISSEGTGYTAAIAGTSGGTGTGLKVSTEVTSLGAISAVTVTSSGSGYTSGDVITISGGNGNAKLIVQNVTTSNGEIMITGYDGVGKIVSGTFKFNAVNVNNDPLAEPALRFQYGNFYIPVK